LEMFLGSIILIRVYTIHVIIGTCVTVEVTFKLEIILCIIQ